MKKNINRLLIVIMILIDLYFIITNVMNGNTDRLINQLSLFIVLPMPWILERITKTKINDNLKLVFNIYILLALVLGVIGRFYDLIPYYDKVMHLASGFLTSMLAVLILKYFKIDIKNKVFAIIFIISFSLLVASFWEFFEFTFDQLLSSNNQRLETGVTDTMLDMIAAFIGSIIYSIIYHIQIK